MRSAKSLFVEMGNHITSTGNEEVAQTVVAAGRMRRDSSSVDYHGAPSCHQYDGAIGREKTRFVKQ